MKNIGHQFLCHTEIFINGNILVLIDNPNQNQVMTTEDPKPRLRVFRTDAGITISFGEKTYFIDKAEPFTILGSNHLNREIIFHFMLKWLAERGRERIYRKPYPPNTKNPCRKSAGLNSQSIILI